MTASSSSGLNGALNGAQPHSSWHLPDTSRPLTFRDALPYYPQTNTLPFLPELVPNPKIEAGSPALSTSDILPPTDLRRLDEAALAQGQLTKEGKQAIGSALQELKGLSTQYKFAPVACSPSSEPQARSLSQGLSQCTRAIFGRVGNRFIDKSASASSVVVDGTSKVETSAATPNKLQHSNATTHKENTTRFEVVIPSKNFDPSAYTDLASQPMPSDTNHQSPSRHLPQRHIDQIPADSLNAQAIEDNNAGFRIEFPSAKINLDEYMEVKAALEEPQNLSRQKNRQNVAGTFAGETLDQRQRADAAVVELRRRVEQISRASSAVYEGEPGFDQIVTMNSEQEPMMTAEEHKKILTTLQKVISMGRFKDVEVDDLVHVLRLSETSLKEVPHLEVLVDNDWDDDVSVFNWLQQVSSMETTLRAARTSLRIITGGRKDQKLSSETVIEESIRAFQKAANDIIIPLVELRNSGDTGRVFKLLLKHKKDLSTIFVTCQKLLYMLSELVTKVQVSDLPLNTLEFVASSLVFVVNAQYDKDSLVGIQKFDGIRIGAMDVLCQIFLIKPEQRSGILNEIMTSLGKLPVTKQGSRQFKLAEGGNIQPISALIMRLVQASSASSKSDKEMRRLDMLRYIDGAHDGEDEDELQDTTQSNSATTIVNEKQASEQPDVAGQDLCNILGPLDQSSLSVVRNVITFLIQRAAGSSKTGETPYRNLLDLIVDDFITCLESPEWPAAELLLRYLANQMLVMFQGERTAAPTKNMALEILGNLISAMSRLRSQTKRLAASIQANETNELLAFLADVASNLLDSPGTYWPSLVWTGPFRVVLESTLSKKDIDAHLECAASFIMTRWAIHIRSSFESDADDDGRRDQDLGRLAYRLRMMIEDRTWLTSQFEFNAVTTAQEKLSYATILLASPLFDGYSTILNELLKSMGSDQATVRSKSLRSVNHVLETDPSILDRFAFVVELIRDCVGDTSTQVRESALSLLGTCMELRPALESALAPEILDRFTDTGVMVRKRAIKLARDMYLRNTAKSLRARISEELLKRVSQDPDETAKESARQMLEEIWFAPFYRMDDSAAFQTSLAEHTKLVMRTAKSYGVDSVLDTVFKTMLKSGATGPVSVCSRLVSALFGLINDPTTENPDDLSGQDALYVLTIFARAEPKLFNFEQIRLLKPLIAANELRNTEYEEQLAPFKYMFIILKHVLPQLSTVHTDFILDLRDLLTARFGKFIWAGPLDEMAACQRVLCDLLEDYTPVKKHFLSCFKGILKGWDRSQPGVKGLESDANVKQFRVYLALGTTLIRHFDLEPHFEIIKRHNPQVLGDSVARMLINAIEPYCSEKELSAPRQYSLEALTGVCQASPRCYTIPKVWELFQQVFKSRHPYLQNIILRSFRTFLTTEERRSEAKAEKGETKSLTVMGGTSYDDVASATTQRFLQDIARIALQGQDLHAQTAVEVLGSINRQGLTHPKEIGVTMITLETSANSKIADIAFREHKLLHGKHESTMEREYSKAVQSAYEYQRDVVKDARGAVVPEGKEYRAKLHNMIDVLKISKMKNRQRLFEKLVALVEFDPEKLDSTPKLPSHLEFTRFIMDNLAFVEYQTVGELQTTVHKLEYIFASIGTGVAQSIDSEVYGVRVDAISEPQQSQQPPLQDTDDKDPVQQQLHQQLNGQTPQAEASEPQINVDTARLRQLTSAAIVLILVWETRGHLRRFYNMGSSRTDTKAKAMAKDLNKTPTKAQGASGDLYWEQTSSIFNALATRDYNISACRHFTTVMNYDNDWKVAKEDEDDVVMDPATPSDRGDDEDQTTPGGRGRKRKNNSTPGGRKKRQRSGSAQPRKRGRPKRNSEPFANNDSDMDWA